MKSKKIISTILALSMVMGIVSCTSTEPTESVTDNTSVTATEVSSDTSSENSEITEETTASDPDKYKGMTAEEICAQLTIEEKASQMVQGAIYSLKYSSMKSNDYGSVLSTFSDWPALAGSQWMEIIRKYQENALASETGIPFIFGQDSVHGVNTASGCVIFPHNINLGAANDVELARRIGEFTGSDIMHTGMIWNFAPCVASAQDPRWGRTYESYSSDLEITKNLAVAYAEGLMSQGVVACAKHFFADGDAKYGTGENSDNTPRLIDRGDAQLTDKEIEERLAVYKALVDSGVQTIMLSHSSLNGVKMHENKEFIDKLKNEMGFEGVIVSDWNSLHNCSGKTYRDNVILCVNAGCDMLMEPDDFGKAKEFIISGYNNGEISEERINDAVIRILKMKINAGLFEDPYLEQMEANAPYEMNSKESHDLAREAAAKSIVPLVDGGNLQIKAGMKVYVTGPAADDTAVMCGGWTYIWDSESDALTGKKWVPSCITILQGLKEASEEIGFEVVTDPKEMNSCDLIVLCVGEEPYSEWQGDTADLSITGSMALSGNKAAIEKVAKSNVPTLTLIVAGRNVIIDEYLKDWDSVVMCYLPGSEGGHGIADVLTGKVPFQGKLAMPYYSSVDQIGTGKCWKDVGFSAVN